MNSDTQSGRIGLAPYDVLMPLDMADAFELLVTVVADRNSSAIIGSGPRSRNGGEIDRHAVDGPPRGIVVLALSLADISADDLEAMRDQPLRDLYRDRRLPIPITLGALIVLDAAQRSEERGRGWDDVLDDATAAVARFLDLVSVLPDVEVRGSEMARYG